MNIGYIVLVCFSFILIGYCFGNILFGEIITKCNKINIYEHGSGNVGGTNVSRLMNPAMGVLVMFLDAIKAYLAIIAAWGIYYYTIRNWSSSYTLYPLIYLAGLFAVIGHCFPLKFIIKLFRAKFKFSIVKKAMGGKGMACSGGALFAISPYILFISFAAWLILFLIWRYVSLGSMICNFVAAPMVFIKQMNMLYLFGNGLYGHDLYFVQNSDYSQILNMMIVEFVIIFTIALIVLLRHISNIKKIQVNKESKMF